MAKYCKNCGNPIGENDSFCPSCGEKIETTQRVEKKKSPAGKIIGIVILCVLAFLGYKFYTEYDYNVKLGNTYNTMLSSARKCEKIGIQTCTVWYNWVNEIKDEETDKYTQRNGGSDLWYDNVDDVLGTLFGDYEFYKQVEDAEKANIELRNLVTKLNNPPNKYTEAYKEFRKTYNLYLEFYRISTNPEGTYNDYSDAFTEADKNFAKQIDILYTYID